MKVGVADGLDDLDLASLVGLYSSNLHCAKDLDSFLLIGELRCLTNYDVLHISGCAACGVLGRPTMRSRSNASELVELSLTKIKEVLVTTSVMPRLVILDSPPLAEEDKEYTKFLEDHSIGALVHYSTRNPSLKDRRHFLPRLLDAILNGRPYQAAVGTGTIMEEGELDLKPKVLFNEKLLGLHESRLKHVSLVYPA